MQHPTLVPSSDAQAAAVPGYSGPSLPEGSYFDDPERLPRRAGQSAKSSNEQSSHHRRTPIDARRSPSNSGDPGGHAEGDVKLRTIHPPYLAGEDYSGGGGSRVPLPPAVKRSTTHEATGNQGTKIRGPGRAPARPRWCRRRRRSTPPHLCGSQQRPRHPARTVRS